MKQVLAIDIGGTNAVHALVNEQGKITGKQSLVTAHYDTAEALAQHIYNDLSNNVNYISAVGIGAPNGNYYNGCIEFAPNLPWKGKIRLAQIFKNKFGVKCVITNDANAAALGEKIFGSARAMNDFIFITLGTGVGSGIFCNGKLVYGHDGLAGEIGHVIVEKNGRHCMCGRKGCLEAYCSAGGFVKTYLEKSRTHISQITAKEIYIKALAGERAALETFDYTAKVLGLALANSVAYTNPEAIFIFGGLAQAHNFLMQPLKMYMEENLLNIYKNKIKLLPSALPENDAAILGAASLVI